MHQELIVLMDLMIKVDQHFPQELKVKINCLLMKPSHLFIDVQIPNQSIC